MSNSNCHARSKQKRKQLRAKNQRIKILIRDTIKMIKSGQADEAPRSGMNALRLKDISASYESARRAMRTAPRMPNQRQKRKLARQQPHGKK